MHSLAVVLVTSPIPSNPSLALIDAVLRSVFEFTDVPCDVPVVIVSDGCVASTGNSYKRGRVTKDAALRYKKFRGALDAAVASRRPPFGSVARVVHLDERVGFAHALKEGVCSIAAEYTMGVQHDQLFVGSFPSMAIVEVMRENPAVRYVGAQSLTTIDYKSKMLKRYGIDIEDYCTTTKFNLKLVPILMRYDKTHIVASQHLLRILSSVQKGCFPEDTIGHAQLDDIKTNGMAAFPKYGTYVLSSGADEIIYHLSGRKLHAASQTAAGALNASINSASLCVANSDAYTTARRRIVALPGIAVPPAASPGDSEGTISKEKAFKGKCFACGKKGHSKSRCPNLI